MRLNQIIEMLQEFFSRPIISGIVAVLQVISIVVVVFSAIGAIVFKRRHHKIIHDFKPEPPEY